MEAIAKDNIWRAKFLVLNDKAAHFQTFKLFHLQKLAVEIHYID